MTETTLSRGQLAERLGVTARQLRYVEEINPLARRNGWKPKDIDRLRVAAALFHAMPASDGAPWQSAFPAIAAKVLLSTPIPPLPPFWVVLTDEVRYVVYRADLAGAVGDGGLVAHVLPEESQP